MTHSHDFNLNSLPETMFKELERAPKSVSHYQERLLVRVTREKFSNGSLSDIKRGFCERKKRSLDSIKRGFWETLGSFKGFLQDELDKPFRKTTLGGTRK